ncbi:MAG: hypothetical protein WCO57_06960 [Verrucomicrobiota bacterium]
MKTTLTLILSLVALAGAEPQAGDADFPTRNGNPRHEQKVAAIKNGNFDLVLIGDSITHEIGELDGKYKPNRSVWDRHFAPRHALNLGMNGQRTEEILWWDLLHPSPLGTEAWVQAAEPLLAQLMGDQPIISD